MFPSLRGFANVLRSAALGRDLVGFPSFSSHPDGRQTPRIAYALGVMMLESLVRADKVPSRLPSRPAHCPRVSCVGKLELDSRMRSMTALGLQALVCPVCNHSGYRSLQGIRVLFATRHEHVCNYGPSLRSLTVVFSGTALVSLRERGLCPTQAALMAAQWALLCGQLVGTLRVSPESPAFMHCFTYVHHEIVHNGPDPSLDAFTEPHPAL